jgi:hypothetical protein
MPYKPSSSFTDISKPLGLLVFTGVFILVLMSTLLHGLPGWDECLGAFLSASFLGFIAFLLGKSMSVPPPKPQRKQVPPAVMVDPLPVAVKEEPEPKEEAPPSSESTGSEGAAFEVETEEEQQEAEETQVSAPA